MKYFFTADEHYGHKNIIKYCDRPFNNVDEMNEELIRRHNEVVGPDDTVFHIGDFALAKDAEKYIRRLTGTHYFIRGSHDYWMTEPDIGHEIMELQVDTIHITLCHYAMRVWPRSHYNSWQLYGHSHGKLKPVGKQMDVGVDTNNFYPYEFKFIKDIMEKKDDNFNVIKI